MKCPAAIKVQMNRMKHKNIFKKKNSNCPTPPPPKTQHIQHIKKKNYKQECTRRVYGS